MRRHIPRTSALQVTPGQCQQCRRRDVRVVLVAEQGGKAGTDQSPRTFYTCEVLDYLMRYEVHRCGQAMPEAA